MNEPETAFVSGGSGFVGRNLIRRLRRQGHAVVALVRTAQAAASVKALGASVIEGDLDAVAVLQRGMQHCQWVFHAAAKVGVQGSAADFHRVNVTGTANMLAAARAASVCCFIHVSTEAVLANGHPLVNLNESTPLPARPLPGYPASKARAEQRVLAANSDALETVIVRPRLIWGADDTSLLPMLVQAVCSGRFRWIGGGRYPTATTHVFNVCEALVLAARHGRPGEVYFVTDGAPVELRAFLTRLLATRGVRIPDASVPHAVASVAATWGDFMHRTLKLAGPPAISRMALRLFGGPVTIDDGKARRELGYRPVITRQQGLDALATAEQSGHG